MPINEKRSDFRKSKDIISDDEFKHFHWIEDRSGDGIKYILKIIKPFEKGNLTQKYLH